MRRAFMGSENAAEGMPEEFRKKMDEYVCNILIESHKVMDLCGRYYCNTSNFTDGEIDVMIRRKDAARDE
jgi:hypothetical protein